MHLETNLGTVTLYFCTTCFCSPLYFPSLLALAAQMHATNKTNNATKNTPFHLNQHLNMTNRTWSHTSSSPKVHALQYPF